ncbi:FumA C-terminus/TtdB family hydratase beta subunit [Candidatus Woesearchaeota archaeon]|nr:FumA C-terminus/TtdB family hydratase beta subunit [Candidatus Woesearchaeota archaeon]
MKKLQLPLSLDDLKSLELNEFVLISGHIITARDKAHRYMTEKRIDNYNGSIIYHCGPIMKKTEGVYSAVSAGPTTSARMSIYTGKLIDMYGVNLIIGKGGLSANAVDSMKGRCVYLSAIGGAGVIYANSISKVIGVKKLEFGMADAIWELKVVDFPAIVSIDIEGNNSYDLIKEKSSMKF